MAEQVTAAGIGDRLRHVFEFRDMAFTVKTKADPHKVLISGISASIESGRVLAIMGPSGAGKTVLLNAITLDAMGGKTTGEVKLNGADLSLPLFRRHCAVCTQEDWHWAYLTCRETLAYAADLYLGGGGGGGGAATAAEKASTVAKLLADLGLTGCADTRVGNQFVKGLSGGQKRRLSIAVVLIKRPAVLFLDEPTSGLDAAAAVGVMRTIRELAVSANLVVICTIHQPSAVIYNAFDQVMVLSSGRVAYRGDAAAAKAYFKSIGHEMDKLTTVAEFMLNKVNREFSDPSQVDAIIAAWAAQEQPPPARDAQACAAALSLLGSKAGQQQADASLAFVPQCATLLRRHWTITKRDPALYLGRAVAFMLIVCFFAVIYVNARVREQRYVLERMWLMMWSVGVPSSLGVIVVFVFNEEYKSIRKEWRNGMVSGGGYLFAKTLIEVPAMLLLSVMALSAGIYGVAKFHGASYLLHVLLYTAVMWSLECMAQLFAVQFDNPLTGMLMYMNNWFSAFLFCGVLVKEEDVIWPFKLFCYILPLKWGIQGFAWLEFNDETFAGAVTAQCPATKFATPPAGCSYHAAQPGTAGFTCPGDPTQQQCYGYSGMQVLETLHEDYRVIEAKDNLALDFAVVFAIALFFKLQYFGMLMMRMKQASKVDAPTAEHKAAIKAAQLGDAIEVVAIAKNLSSGV